MSNAGSQTLTNSGTITGGWLAGSISNSSGTVSGVTVASLGQVNFGNVVGLVINNGTLSGTTIGNGPSSATISGSGMIGGVTTAKGAYITGATNLSGGVLTATTYASTWDGGTNNGTLTAAAGGTLSIIGNPVTNNGTINGAGGGTVMLTSGATVNNGALGTVENVSLTGVTLTGGTLAGANFATGSNILENLINSGTTTIGSDTTTLQGTISNTGSFNVASGALLALTGGLTVDGGTISTGVGSGLVQSDGAVALNNTLNPGGFNALVNSGTLSSNNGWNIGSSDTTTVAGGATLNVTGGSIDNHGTLQVDGTVDGGDYLQYTGSVLALNGSLMVNTANLLGGSVTGNGYFGSNNSSSVTTVNNSGVALDVGGTASAGANSWTLESYNQTNDPLASIEFDIAGPSAYDQLFLLSAFSLGGKLLVDGNYYSDNTAVYDLIHSSGLRTGYFSSFSLGPSVVAGWGLHYDSNAVYLSYTAPAAVPEPAPYWLIGGAFLAVGLIRRRRVSK